MTLTLPSLKKLYSKGISHQVINKYMEVQPGRVFMVADFLIISSILLLPDKSIQDLVYGYVVTVAFSYTIDQMLTGSKQSVQMLIITGKYQEMADKLCFEMDKGVTAVNSIGWYKKSESMIIMVVTRNYGDGSLRRGF